MPRQVARNQEGHTYSMCEGMCVDMCGNMCADMCIDMSIDVPHPAADEQERHDLRAGLFGMNVHGHVPGHIHMTVGIACVWTSVSTCTCP